MVLASQNLSFVDQFFIYFSFIFRIPSWRAFLIDFLWKWSQKVTERYPKGPQRRPNGCPRVPKATKSPLKKLSSPIPFLTLWPKTLPGYPQGCPRDPKASKTIVFLQMFMFFWLFLIVFDCFFGKIFLSHARQDKQGKARQGKKTQDKTRQDRTRQDKARQDKIRQDRTTPLHPIRFTKGGHFKAG